MSKNYDSHWSVTYHHSIGTVIFLVFFVLKICGKLTWSWWWVTSPLWIPVGIALLLLLAVGIKLMTE
jgi:hypothetical protein